MSAIRFIGSTAYVIDRGVRLIGGRLVNRLGRKVPAASKKKATKGRRKDLSSATQDEKSELAADDRDRD